MSTSTTSSSSLRKPHFAVLIPAHPAHSSSPSSSKAPSVVSNSSTSRFHPSSALDTPQSALSPQKRRAQTQVIDLSNDSDDDMVILSPPRASTSKAIDASRDKQKVKKLKHEFGLSVGELARRREHFLCANATVFTPLLLGRNFFSERLGSRSEWREVVPQKRLEQPKEIKGGSMKDYQLVGMSWLAYCWENGANAILADEMGLGKTLQTLSLFAYIHETHGTKGPHLIICPLSVLSSWMTEIARWLPSFTSIRFHGSVAAERKRLQSLKVPDIVVATYESHKIKNHETNAAKELQGIGAQFRLILSGTPLQNNLTELWSLLHWLYKDVFTSATQKRFADSFDLSMGTYDADFMKHSKQLLELIMLRRTKESVKGQLSVPPREEMTLYVPLSPVQRWWYKRLLTRMNDTALEAIFPSSVQHDPEARENVERAMAGGMKMQQMTALLMQLRQTCDHPYILPDAESEPFEVAEHIVGASSKLMLLDKLLEDVVKKKNGRVLIFSGFTRMLDIVEDFMNLRGYKYGRIDGQTPRPRRTLEIKLFQQEKSPYEVLLISTRAGGLGINLTKATTVVLCESDWNPQVDLQAIARAHRIGQTKTVQVFRLVTQDSVEEQMLSRIKKKMYLAAKVMNTMRNAATHALIDEDAEEARPEERQRMDRSELLDILRGGASALGSKWGSADEDPFIEFSNSTFEQLVEKGKARDEEKQVAVRVDAGEAVSSEERAELRRLEEEEEEKMLLAGREMVSSRHFEGNYYAKSNAEIRKEFEATVRRVGHSRTVMIDGHAIMAETLGNARWEAVKTITSDPEQLEKLKVKKRSSKKFGHESWCMSCQDGGTLLCCETCPRVAHKECVGFEDSGRNKQIVCERNTAEAGGMLFRCQTCPDSFCEDDLPDHFDAVGPKIPEFLLLGFDAKSSVYFIRCQACLKDDEERPAESKAFKAQQQSLWDELEMRD
ncbi:hypothetical protein MNV49_000534 [Pseudohyphozyma bogoriensis]|nr:hypothetical protein MNV49_000534 [Pseudohyphozyma bogoriensis]